ncbi:hypothetical protein MYU51_001465 [Penicillium brevicompactum]|uniref:uncharacterized protein n=1 Tax=Penicillium brevicompactum TaxID=5074 RepID=UPI002540AD5A|nr:uncharacterized protein N7506_010003 [Penicillium brevicompactum]KAJ5326901.1 hypothetical protein N7506_010003 [Penicillium brevicompactum]
MSSAVNIYSADPAFPVLADGLLGQSKPAENDTTSHNPTSRNNWSLKDDWLSGLKSSNRAVFRSGAVLGFSRLQGRSNESNEYIAQIPRYLLTKQLRSIDPSQETSAFIIHPGSFEGFAPRTLLNDLQSSSEDQPGLSREEAIKRLDSVQLLPVHSFVNAAQAIGKVSEVLQGMKETQEQSSGPDDPTKPPIILIVAGLDYLAEGVIRSSNPAKGAAFLTATLRTLSRLSRVHASRLSIMLVNTSGLGTMNSAWDKYPQSTDHHGHGDARHPLEGGIYSIFHSDIPSLFPTLLMKTLDQGIDTHLLLSDSKGCEVVEVIKDRTGGGLGKWGIWRQH